MNVWLPDKWLELPFYTAIPGRAVLVDVFYSSSIKDQFLSRKVKKKRPLSIIARELAGKPDLIAKWGKYLINEGVGFTIKKASARMDDARRTSSLQTFSSIVGRVEAVGDSVKTVKPGWMVAGIGCLGPTHAEFVILPEILSVRLPENLPHEPAAFALHGTMALRAVEKILSAQGSGPVYVFGGNSWGSLSAQELLAHDQETVLHLLPGETSSLPPDIVRQVKFSSLSGLIGQAGRILLCNPEFVTCLPPEGENKVCLVINGEEKACQAARTQGWNLENLRLPDPHKEQNLNLDINSDDPLDLPEWCDRKYLAGFLDRLKAGKLKIEEKAIEASNYEISHKKTARLISYKNSVKKKQRRYSNPDAPPATGREKIGVALIGAGNFSRHFHIPFLQGKPEVRLKGVADIDPFQTSYAARFYGFEYCTTDPSDIFDDPETDLIYIVTYHDSHGPLAVEALKAGKGVFAEKPPVLNYGQLKELSRTVKESAGYLTIAYNRRFAPALQAFRKLAGKEKGPCNITCNVRQWDIPANHWYYWKKEGGRICANLCHFIDLCYFLTDRARPLSVSVISSALGRPDQNVAAVIRFADGSLGNILYGSRGNSHPEGQEWIDYRRGDLTVTIDDWKSLKAFKNGREAASWQGGKRDQGHDNQRDGCLRDILAGNPSPYTLKDMVVTSLVMLKAKQSMETGKTVEIPEKEIESYL